MKINVTIATPDDQMWGSSDPDGINVYASYDRYCELVAEKLAAMWPGAEIAVGWDADDQDDSIEVDGDGDGPAGDRDSISNVIQTVHGNWAWVVENA